jgi:antitoxin VapB
MERTAKIFLNNKSQAVRLPKDFQFKVSEVFIRRVGDDVVISPRPADWADYLQNGVKAPADYLNALDDLPVQERVL